MRAVAVSWSHFMSAAMEKHYSVQEVSEIWGVSTNTVRRIFEDMTGVLKISYPSLIKRKKRKPRTILRIPTSLLGKRPMNPSSQRPVRAA